MQYFCSSVTKFDVLLMRHDITDNILFPSITSDWSLNKEFEQHGQFSRMDELEQYKGSDGIYHFK